MSKRKKPTIKQITKVTNNIIIELERTKNVVGGLDFVLNEYIKYRKDDVKFKKHMDGIVDERKKAEDKNRVSDNTSNNG